jgi:hypothetical protein
MYFYTIRDITLEPKVLAIVQIPARGPERLDSVASIMGYVK